MPRSADAGLDDPTARKRVLIINTGGTMGMRPTETGLAPAAGYLRERILSMEEFSFSVRAALCPQRAR